ncbi:NF-kappa-B inhibitor zeta I-kappa-B-zeta [Triplophysa tibetana]|uniref:NF-kappa-B inhibitor zeta I-kappa-B-zeta n=1 Tax=Triplophysa tibetana TaxID=1572043 RepID=A0A5A9PM09_9TELE|nr:NF-kappa-B inhibitor zeta I-kappa-B-zeta [Triplophysa tibetana]
MIIDGVCEDFYTFLDRDTDVLTSPINLASFYNCASPDEPNLTAGSPISGSVQSWNNNSPQNCVNVKASRYQGVRVKNTVKELIMQKRHDVQAQQYNMETEFPAVSHKRSAENLFHYPEKRHTPADRNMSPCSQSGDIFYEWEMLDDINNDWSKERLSIESVVVKGCPAVHQSLYADVETPTYTACHLLPPTENVYPPSIQIQSPPMAPGPSMTSAPPVSFFEWQIQQEDEKLAALTHVELTSRDEDGDTFLHIAVAQGRRALAFVLARKMAAINVLDMKEHNKQSAFQVSVAANQHLIAQDLLSLGAEIDTLDYWGRSPLHVCAEKGHTLTLQAIQKSMQINGRHVNIEAVNYDGLAPLHVAVLSHNAVVQELACQRTPPSGHTVSLLQRRKLLGECINTLLLMGASIEAKDRKSGRTALHMAAEEANIELLRLFLDQPNFCSVINTKAFNGNTALHVVSAVQGRQAQLDAVRLLLRRGADPGTKNLENEQAAQLVPEGPMGDQVRRTLKGKIAYSRP